MNRQAMREHQRAAFANIIGNMLGINIFLQLIRCQNHHHIGPSRRIGNVLNLNAFGFGFGNRAGAVAQTDANLLNAAVAQIEQMGMALRTITDHGHFFVFNQICICVAFIKHFHQFAP